MSWIFELRIYEQLLMYTRNNISFNLVALWEIELTNPCIHKLIKAYEIDNNGIRAAQNYKSRYLMKVNPII